MNKEDLLPYVLPIATVLFLFIFFLASDNFITGFVVSKPVITGYVKINALGNLPDNCNVVVNFYNNGLIINGVNLTSEEFLSKARTEKNALEEIYFLDINKIADEKAEFNNIVAEVWCDNKFVTTASSSL